MDHYNDLKLTEKRKSSCALSLNKNVPSAKVVVIIKLSIA